MNFFVLIYEMLEKRQINFIKGFILLVGTYVNIVISMLFTFFELIGTDAGILDFSIIFTYNDLITQLFLLGVYLYLSLEIMIFSILILASNHDKYQIQMKLLIWFNTLQTWCLFEYMLDILLIQIICYFQSENVINAANFYLSCIFLIVFFISTFFNIIFLINQEINKKDKLSSQYGNVLYYLVILRTFIILYRKLLSRGGFAQILYIAIHLGVSILSIYDLVVGKLSMAFNELYLNKVVLYLVSIYIGLSLTFLIIYISSIDNFYVVCIISITLSCVIINQLYNKVKINSLKIKPKSSLQFIRQNYFMYREKNQDFHLLLMTGCVKQKEQFNASILEKYEIYVKQYPKDYEIQIKFAQFLYFKLRIYAKALIICKQLQNTKMSYTQQMNLSLLIQKMTHNSNQMNNNIAYQGLLDFELVVFAEDQISQLFKHMKQILFLQIKFWKSINVMGVREDNLISLDKQVQQEIENCSKIWKLLSRKQLVRKRMRWVYLQIWYKLFILNKTLRRSEEEQSQSLIEPIVNEESDSEEEQNAYDFMKPFSEISAIFHTDYKGSITGVNKYSYKIFGLKEFINISQIIPEMLQNSHTNQMRNFMQKGEVKSMHKRSKVLCRDSGGYLIEAKKYLKWHITPSTQLEFICMIRPMIKVINTNYILLDRNWIIQSTTEQIQQYFQIPFPLLLLNPKLFSYSRFNLTVEQIEQLQYRMNNQTMNQFIKMIFDEENQLKNKKLEIEESSFSIILSIPKKMEYEFKPKFMNSSAESCIQFPKIKWNILKRKIKLYQQQFDSQFIQQLVEQFSQDCSTVRQINLIVRMDCQLKYMKQRNGVDFILLKIHRYDVIENSLKIKKKQAFRVSNFQTIAADQNLLLLNFESQRSEKPLITDNQIQNDFMETKINNITLKTENNIYIKDDSNKIKKRLRQSEYLTIMNRSLFFILQIITTLSMIDGIFFEIKNLKLNGTDQISKIFNIQVAFMQTYDTLIDVILFNEKYLSGNSTEFYQEKSDKIFEIFDYIYFVYAKNGFVQTLYEFGLNYNESQNIIDLIDQYQINLVLITQSNLEDILFTYLPYEEFEELIIPQLLVAFRMTYYDLISSINNELELNMLISKTLMILIFSLAGISLFIQNGLIVKLLFKYQLIMKQLIQLNQLNIFECLSYYSQIKQQLNWLSQKHSELIYTPRNQGTVDNQDQKQKNYESSKYWKQLTLKISFFKFILISIMIMPIICYLLWLMDCIQKSIDLITYNKFILITNDIWLVPILKELYINKNIMRTKINVTACEEVLQNYMNESLWITNIDEINNIFINDMCDEDQQCINDGIISVGISSYNNQMEQLVKTFILDDQRYQDISLDVIYQIDKYQQQYLEGMVKSHKIWRDIFDANLINPYNVIIGLMILSIILYFILFEWYFRKILQQQLVMVKKIYKNYIPNEVMNQQKRIRATFIKNQII